jgi:hypothetical protein
MYTLSVRYIHDMVEDTNDPILRKLHEYCDRMKISIVESRYDPIQRSEDRHYIERLPAIHVYINNGYEETIYPDTQPVQSIQSFYDTYELKNLEALSKKQIWEERIRYLRSVFKSKKRILESHVSEYM